MPNKIMNMGELGLLLWQEEKNNATLAQCNYMKKADQTSLIQLSLQHIKVKLIFVKSIKCWFATVSLRKSGLNASQMPKNLCGYSGTDNKINN